MNERKKSLYDKLCFTISRLENSDVAENTTDKYFKGIIEDAITELIRIQNAWEEVIGLVDNDK